MARSRLSLVLVLLVASRFLNASQNDSDTSSEDIDSSEQNSGKTSLLCVTFVNPEQEEVKLKVEDSSKTSDAFSVWLGDCESEYTDVLKVQAMNGDAHKINLKISLGDYDATCLTTTNKKYPTLRKITGDDPKRNVTCVKASLQAFKIDDTENDGLCTSGRTLKRTELPFSSTKSSVASEEDCTNSTLTPDQTTTRADDATALHDQDTTPPVETKPSSPVLLTVLVLEVVATCVMAVLVVWVVHSGGNRGVTPATTDVRRNSHQDEVFICENDLYEPFTGPPAMPPAAQATGGQD